MAAIQSDNDNWYRPDDFSMTVSQEAEGSAVLRLAGDFDLSTAADLRECLVAGEVLDAHRVRVDLTQVTFLDSTSIGLLVSAAKAVRKTGAAFSIHCGDGPAGHVLQISGLIEFFEVEATSTRAPRSVG